MSCAGIVLISDTFRTSFLTPVPVETNACPKTLFFCPSSNFVDDLPRLTQKVLYRLEHVFVNFSSRRCIVGLIEQVAIGSCRMSLGLCVLQQAIAVSAAAIAQTNLLLEVRGVFQKQYLSLDDHTGNQMS